MRNLISSEFYRLRKEKSLFIIFIVFTALSFLSSFGQTLLAVIFEELYGEQLVYPNTREVFAASFDLSSNLGLFLLISSIVVCCREFQYGSIRNKIISGYKRSEIYFSKLIVLTCYALVLSVAYSLLTLLFYIFSLGYIGAEFNLMEFIEYIKIFLCGSLIIVTNYCLIYALSMFLNSTWKTIGIYIGILLFLGIIESSISSHFILLEQFDIAEEIISWFPDYQATCLSNNDLLDSIAIKTIITNIVCPAVISFVGYKIFKNKEIK